MSEDKKCSKCGTKLLHHFGDIYSCPKCNPQTGFFLESGSIADLLDVPTIIKIVVKDRGIETDVTAHNPLDCVMIAGVVAHTLRSVGYKPDVVILP